VRFVPTPWWFSDVDVLGAYDTTTASMGALWHVSERLRFVRENVSARDLADDEAVHPATSSTWQRFVDQERTVRHALVAATDVEAELVRSKGREPAAFRAHWEGLGFAPHTVGAGTPADDYLDALFRTSRLVFDGPASALATVNLASRAQRVSDFLGLTAPAAGDVVFDLGSGSGKVALTVAASCVTRVEGVELVGAHVLEARASAEALGLDSARFHEADVRDVDLRSGSIFYLYFPFRGAVASAVASTLGALAREKDITVYASGPAWDYGEFFLREVERGALRLTERRGAHDEVMVLKSERR
jgi:23S rRNA (uracil1939-C5)-methyltransferase